MRKHLILLAIVGGVTARAQDHLGSDHLLSLAPADATASSGATAAEATNNVVTNNVETLSRPLYRPWTVGVKKQQTKQFNNKND